MRIVEGTAAFAAARPAGATAPPVSVALGNFDGVHRGHQALLREARRRAAARAGGIPAVLTFMPHPARVFAPATAPPLIMPLPRRLELLADAGVELVVVEPFTRAFAATEAEEFVREVLARRLGARDVVVGYDFSFGRGRRGDPALLQRLGRDGDGGGGMTVTVVAPVAADGGLVCSSTKVRELVTAGNVAQAALLLGRPFEITGTVVRGAGRGRGLGIPTANVAPEGELLPRLGIYAGRARLLEGGQGGGDGVAAPGPGLRAAISVGSNPTFVDGGAVTVEAYCLDFDGDLYGRRLRLELTERLRDEQRFDSVDALLAQIAADVAQVRAVVP